MRSLWVDTGPLLELVAYELLRVGSGRAISAYGRLAPMLVVLTSKTRVARFEDRVRELRFGQLRYSAGSVVELHRLVRERLAPNRDAVDLLEEFWATWSVVVSARRRALKCFPIDIASIDPAALARFGPVDAHLVGAVASDSDSWLFTGDAPLIRFAAGRVGRRIFEL